MIKNIRYSCVAFFLLLILLTTILREYVYGITLAYFIPMWFILLYSSYTKKISMGYLLLLTNLILVPLVLLFIKMPDHKKVSLSLFMSMLIAVSIYGYFFVKDIFANKSTT